MLADIRAVCLDLDGTLVDTEPLHTLGHHQVLRARGITITDAEIHANIGASDRRFYEGLMARFGVAGDAVAWCEEKRLWVQDRIRAGVPLRPGVVELLDELDRRGLPRCVVTSSRREVFTLIMAGTGLGPRLPLSVCSEDTVPHKPDPAPYLLACQLLGCEAAAALAIEDSVPGLRAALAAGCRAVGFAGLVSASRLREAGEICVVDDLRELLA